MIILFCVPSILASSLFSFCLHLCVKHLCLGLRVSHVSMFIFCYLHVLFSVFVRLQSQVWVSAPMFCYFLFYFGTLCSTCIMFSFASTVSSVWLVLAVFASVACSMLFTAFIYCLSLLLFLVAISLLLCDPFESSSWIPASSFSELFCILFSLF